MSDLLRTPLPPALVAALAVAAVAGCGGDPVAEPSGVGAVRAGSVAQLASCGDWREGSVEERFATIDQVRSQVDPGGNPETPSLSDEGAYELFESACAPEYATGFRLYKLYARGASFNPLAE